MYLTKDTEIREAIEILSRAKILWVDTETADWQTSKPKLSLIQILADRDDRTGNATYILDVLEKPELVKEFVQNIMENSNIEKVFHNASYDLKFLGKTEAKNITCTWKLAKQITCKRLGTSNLKLKTLAAELCHFPNVNAEPQSSDWGKRPLSAEQLKYAKLDTVYLAQVYHHLLELTAKVPNVEEAPMPSTQTPDRPSFSVTNLRVAFECPRLFYLQQRFGGKTVFLPKNQYAGIGNPFHNLAQKFVELALQDSRFRSLLSPSAEQLEVEEVAQGVQQLFYTLTFLPYLQSRLKEDPNLAPTLNQIWQGIRGLIRHYAALLVTNRYHCHADAVIPATFVDRELRVESDFHLPDGTQQLVRGQFDSLIYNFDSRRLCAVEYKTYQAADLSAQLVQVALYSYMLQQQKNEPVDAAVYCVLPEFKEYRFSWEELERTVHQLIPHKLQQMQQWLKWEAPQSDPPPPTTQPHLCKICPQQQKCQSHFDRETKSPQTTDTRSQTQGETKPPQTTDTTSQTQRETKPPQTTDTRSQTQRETKPPASPEAPPQTDAIAQDLVAVLQSFGVGTDYLGAAVAPAFIRVKLKPHLGVKVVSILNRSADLQVQLGIAVPPLIAPQPGYVSVDLPRGDRQIAHFEDYIQPTETPPTAPLRIAIGVNLEGQLMEAELSDPNTCHFLVGGTTGSGKSEFLRSLLLSLLHRHTAQQLKIALVDPKRVTFPEFERMPWLHSPVVKDSDRAIELMAELVDEMDRRYQRFEVSGCNDLASYNQKRMRQNQSLEAPIVCIFDEYADFMSEKETRSQLEQSIKRLGAMARAAGIHLIVATQRPEAKVVTPIIRSNLPGRVALRTASEADSEIVLGGNQKTAASLLGKGDLLYKGGGRVHRLQSLFANSIELG